MGLLKLSNMADWETHDLKETREKLIYKKTSNDNDLTSLIVNIFFGGCVTYSELRLCNSNSAESQQQQPNSEEEVAIWQSEVYGNGQLMMRMKKKEEEERERKGNEEEEEEEQE